MKHKIYTILIVTFLILSTLPLMNLSRYTHPSADDYALSVDTKKEWEENHSIIGLLREAHNVQERWSNSWENVYTSYYLWALQPGIFGERYYKLTGFINIAILGFATMVFFIIVVKRILGGKVYQGIILGSIALIMMYQWMPSAVEGLYWFCGSVGYNLFWALSLLILSGIILYSGEKTDVILEIFLVLGGFLLAGGNHVTSFAGMIAFLTTGLWAFINKQRKKGIVCTLVLAATFIGFLFNVLSPGTTVRSNFFPDKLGVFETIWLALENGMMAIEEWVTLPLLFGIILIMPIVIGLCSKYIEEHNFKFRYPLLVFAFSVGYLCAMFCPTLYVMKNTGGGRVRNAEYFTFIVLVFINCIYFTGYALCKLKEQNINIFSGWKDKVPMKYLLLTVLFVGGILIWPIKTSNGYQAVQTVILGDAGKFSEEAQNRYELAMNSQGEDIEIMEHTVKPEMLYFDDITGDSASSSNMYYADYYGLKSVRLKYWSELE